MFVPVSLVEDLQLPKVSSQPVIVVYHLSLRSIFNFETDINEILLESTLVTFKVDILYTKVHVRT